MREKNLYDTSRQPSVNAPDPPRTTPKVLAQRSVDGSYNDLDHPEIGMAGSRFGRNVAIADTWRDEATVHETLARHLLLVQRHREQRSKIVRPTG